MWLNLIMFLFSFSIRFFVWKPQNRIPKSFSFSFRSVLNSATGESIKLFWWYFYGILWNFAVVKLNIKRIKKIKNVWPELKGHLSERVHLVLPDKHFLSHHMYKTWCSLLMDNRMGHRKMLTQTHHNHQSTITLTTNIIIMTKLCRPAIVQPEKWNSLGMINVIHLMMGFTLIISKLLIFENFNKYLLWFKLLVFSGEFFS